MISPGPAHEAYTGLEWTKEDQILAPSRRWLLLIVGLTSFDYFREHTDAFSISEIDGFQVCVFLPPKSGLLRVELEDDAIRVHELDASQETPSK
jgi:hypothetical protein